MHYTHARTHIRAHSRHLTQFLLSGVSHPIHRCHVNWKPYSRDFRFPEIDIEYEYVRQFSSNSTVQRISSSEGISTQSLAIVKTS
jgi:hypothetical protein